MADPNHGGLPLSQHLVLEPKALLPSDEPLPPCLRPQLRSKDDSRGCSVVVLQHRDGEQHDGAEDGCLVSEREILRLIVQKSAVVTEVTDDGDEGGVQNNDEL